MSKTKQLKHEKILSKILLSLGRAGDELEKLEEMVFKTDFDQDPSIDLKLLESAKIDLCKTAHIINGVALRLDPQLEAVSKGEY